MDFFIGTLVGGVVVALWIRRRRSRQKPSAKGTTPEADGSTARSRASRELLRLAGKCSDCYEESASPADLLAHDDFRKGVDILRGELFSASDCISYYIGANLVLACMAVEALAHRSDDPEQFEEALIEHVNSVGYWTRDVVLRTLSARGTRPLVGRVFARLDGGWDTRFSIQFLQEFLERQVAHGEQPSFAQHLLSRPQAAADLTEVLRQLQGEAAETLRKEYQDYAAVAVDVSFLDKFGRRLGQADAPESEEVLEYRQLLKTVDDLQRLLQQGTGSVLLVGEAGIGKSASIAVLARRLVKDGWTVFEASASDIMSDQSYIGSLEGRLQTMLKGIGNRPRVLWVVPSFHELMWAGRHRENPVSVLDHLFPHLESGALRIVAETHPVASQEMLLKQPRLRTALQLHSMTPLDEAGARDVVAEWSAHHKLPDGSPGLAPGCEAEAVQLSWQYLGSRAAPGRVLRFLDATRRSLSTDGRPTRSLTTDDLLASLSVLTGIPVSVLDHRARLDLDTLKRFFEKRVLGQPEAVECLVDRVALVKAGLTDPSRPLGVFLFTGPTGTGKTELAKTLAEYLFGSGERMIRLDMSELQAEGSLDRVLGDEQEGGRGGALVDAIRQQPFSVVLLDEFEKAHPKIYSVFLQLFDDGRLTDRRGRAADFRHAIVIMTSNLGGKPSASSGVGFGRTTTAQRVDRALEQAFAPEFVNRIDRVVAFRPLGRAIMRDILEKELSDAMRRRGLRTRSWAVEWEESAIDFLLRKGFTPDLGARPLKRAVERYLLSPLAKTIVHHQYPEGDQFLFVRSNGQQLQVEFVDPDAPIDAEAPAGATTGEGTNRQVEEIVFQPHGTAQELALLRDRTQQLSERVHSDAWREQKEQALDQMKEAGFWEADLRFAVLGRIEYMDRIETGTETATSILERLSRARADENGRVSQKLVGRLAQQVFLVQNACLGLAEGQPADTFIEVTGVSDDGVDPDVSNGFAQQLVEMYRHWAQRRGMSLDVLENSSDDAPHGQVHRTVLGVSGFGAYRILEPEGGLHVQEIPDEGRRQTLRGRARVTVVPQPEQPAADVVMAREQAHTALAACERAQRVVRRYRAQPSPLVRDSVRNFKTGLLERVMGGEFDVLGTR